MKQQDRAIVADFWSKTDCSASDRNFYCFPPIRARACQLIFGESDASRPDWCEYWTIEKYLKDKIPFEKCISVCCGFGEIERTLSRLNLAKKIIGTDIAPGAIEQARQKARAEGLGNIEYYVADMNHEKFPENEYDIIWANGALHHVEDLDNVIGMLRNALKPGGYLISNEYVGPNYQQLSKRQQEIINAAKHLLYPEFRKPCDPFGKAWEMPSVEKFLKTDPSECINSSQIVPLIKKHFEDVEVKHFHGSIIFYLLDSHFYDNFDFNNPKHRRLLEMLFELEDMFIEAGDISSDNAHIICRKKVTSPRRFEDRSQDQGFNTISNSVNKSAKAPLVLLYHRVANDPIDSQLLAVTPEKFEGHLKVLSENYRVLPLHQLLGQISRGQLQPNTAAITFDDGYLDNLTNAVPLLEKYGLPATVFVTSGMVGWEGEFWWDALERIFLTGLPLPEFLNISGPQGTSRLDLTGAQNRLKAYDTVCGLLRDLPVEEIHKSVGQLLAFAGQTHAGRATHRTVDANQLRMLASSPSIEIGSHTVTHTRLSILPPDKQRLEIRHSKQQLESLIRKPVRLFSYPYGSASDFSKETAQILAEEGYEAGIANIQGDIVMPADLYAIPRRLVRNWSAHQFSHWLMDDKKDRLEEQTISGRAQKIIDALSSLNTPVVAVR
jgi:peptidoglycan/xylan/chitin deacetylase (PgdA/CDA1 family)/ubiquinone/menaquinone biosynthesis C-methylase UbiE